jgi:hypothetical protein
MMVVVVVVASHPPINPWALQSRFAPCILHRQGNICPFSTTDTEGVGP